MKTGRNEPCPCGSGKKYKQCCGAGREAAPREPPAAELAFLSQAMGAHAHASVEARSRELLQQYPASGFLWKSLGIALAIQQKPALAALEKAAQLMPQDADAHFNLGHALREQRRLAEARARYARVVELRPDFGLAYLHLASAQKELGELDAAVRSYQRGVRLLPTSAAAHGNLGGALHELGRLREAVDSYRTALQLDPALAETHGNLGAALLTLGQPDAAVVSLQRALQLDPRFALAHLHLGNAFQRLGSPAEAAASYRRCLQLEPRLAAAYTNLGNAQREQGQSDDALASHRQALAIDPSLAVAHGNLATTLQERGQLAEAEASLRHALELNADAAELHANLAAILQSQGRTMDASAACLKALELDPDLSSALALQAELDADRGRFDEAAERYRRAIAIDPDFAQAWAGLAGLRMMTPEDAPWLVQAQRLLDRRLPVRQEIQLRYAVGKYFDDVRDYPAAFAHFQRANELSKQIAPRYDAAAWDAQVTSTIGRYDRESLAAASADGEPSDRPVFIVGMPRSGTSLVEQILASLPSVHGGGELPFWTQAAAVYEQGSADPGSLADRRRDLARDYLRLLQDLSTSALRVTDKMPANFLHLGLIHATFPQAHIVYLRRHPLDTCLSIYFQNFGASHSYSIDLDDLAHFYAQHDRLMAHWKSVLPGAALLEVPYEALIQEPEIWSRRLLSFTGLPWDARCLAFNETERVVATRSRWQVRQKISRASVERWRHYDDFVGPLRGLLADDHPVA